MIQVLRGIAVIFVILEHINICGFGAFGVDIFFIISGFMAMYSTADKSKQKGFSFIIKRFFRISPLYYALTLVMALVIVLFPGIFEKTSFQPVFLLKSLLYIPYSNHDIVMPLVRVGWCLNYEMLFYLIFFISMKISHRLRGLLSFIVCTALSIIGRFIAFGNIMLDFWTTDIIAEFSMGIIAYYICYLGYPLFAACKKKKRLRTVLLVCIILYSTALIIFMCRPPYVIHVEQMIRVVNWGVPSFIIFVLAFWVGCMFDVPDALTKPGNISYSLFLIHYPIIMVTNRIGERFGSYPAKLLLALAGVFASVVISIPAYYIFEKKIYGFFKKT